MAEAKPILMPKLGQTVEESSIVRWHKQEGDAIMKGEVIFEIETDKAVLESEAFADGTLLKIIVPEGVSVPVQSVVAFIGEPGDSIPEVKPIQKKPPVPTPEKKVVQPKVVPPPRAETPAPDSTSSAMPSRMLISPRARKLCEERGIHYNPIRGTGPRGRVIEKDVIAYLDERNYDAIRISPAARNLARAEELDILELEGMGEGGRIMLEDVKRAAREKPVKMSKMRQIIAERLSHSFRNIPHFFVTVSVDMTDLIVLRTKLKQEGKPYSINDFIMRAVVLSLKGHDPVNSMTPDGIHVRWNSKVHLGVAVSLDEGLVVPVIRAAEELSLDELHERARDLALRARDGKLSPDEMQGSTFTISNMGMLGIEQFNAIINPGEGAILAIAAVQPTPVVRDGEIVAREVMKITLSADHRVIDGAVGAAFVNSVKSNLENAERMLND